jgi:hypothetical protein
VLFAGPGQPFDELHVELDPMTGQLLLVALPALLVTLVALRCPQPAHVEPLEDPPDGGVTDLDVVIALQVHRDLQRTEVVVLTQVDDLADDLWLRGASMTKAFTLVPRPRATTSAVSARSTPSLPILNLRGIRMDHLQAHVGS